MPLKSVLIYDELQFVREALVGKIAERWPDADIRSSASCCGPYASEDGFEPDVVILDRGGDCRDLLSCCVGLFQKWEDAKVVIFSGSLTGDEALALLKCGAAAYVPKTFSINALCHVLDLVMSGATYAPKSLLSGIVPGAVTTKNSKKLNLTDREEYMLARFVEGASNKEIAHLMGASEAAVKQVARNLFKKLGVRNRTQAAVKGLHGDFGNTFSPKQL
nr:response regulator transcription factor [uncultured Hyphomonas sp.]